MPMKIYHLKKMIPFFSGFLFYKKKIIGMPEFVVSCMVLGLLIFGAVFHWWKNIFFDFIIMSVLLSLNWVDDDGFYCGENRFLALFFNWIGAGGFYCKKTRLWAKNFIANILLFMFASIFFLRWFATSGYVSFISIFLSLLTTVLIVLRVYTLLQISKE